MNVYDWAHARYKRDIANGMPRSRALAWMATAIARRGPHAHMRAKAVSVLKKLGLPASGIPRSQAMAAGPKKAGKRRRTTSQRSTAPRYAAGAGKTYRSKRPRMAQRGRGNFLIPQPSRTASMPSISPDPGCATLCQVYRGLNIGPPNSGNPVPDNKYIMMFYTASDFRGMIFESSANPSVPTHEDELRYQTWYNDHWSVIFNAPFYLPLHVLQSSITYAADLYNFLLAYPSQNIPVTPLLLPNFARGGGATPAVTQFPLQIRPGRMGIRLRNVSTPTSTAGSIRVLNTPQTFDMNVYHSGDANARATNIQTATVTQLETMMSNDPNVRTITCYDLMEERQWTLLPTSDAYHEYDLYKQAWVTVTPDAGQNSQATPQALVQEACKNPKMGTLVIQIPKSAVIDLSYTIMCDDVVRFPAQTTLSYLHKVPWNISQAAHTAYTNRAYSMANGFPTKKMDYGGRY